ncbi:MAG: clostripain-related cysteine peptidase [Candidatus Ozemobacteraceae bacterium]
MNKFNYKTKLPNVILMLLFFFAAVTSFGQEVVQMPQPEKEWTFMIFMAADNNLEAASSIDINELEKYGSTDKVNYVAQIDRNGGYSNQSELKWSGTRRFYVVKDKSKKMTSPMIEDLGDLDSADPLTLTEYVSWAKENFPAKKYALILWNHGTGWKEISPSMDESAIEEGRGFEIGLGSGFGGMPQNAGAIKQTKQDLPESLKNIIPNISYNISYDYTSNTSMDIPTLAETLVRVKGVLGKPIEMLGFDACLMQMAEVGWAAAPSAKCQVGSPDLEPERGWPYDMISKELNANPEMDGIALGKVIAEAYTKSYSGGSQGNTAVAISVMDFSRVEDFRSDLNAFCDAVIRNISKDIDRVEENRNKTLMYSYSDYIDLGHFLALMAQDKAVSASTKTSALNLLKTICGNRGEGGFVARVASNKDKFKNTRGLSIFFPTRMGFNSYKTRYKAQPMTRETKWFEFLGELAKPNMPYFKLEDIKYIDNNKDGRIAAGEKVEGKVIIKNFGRKTIENAVVTFESKSKYLEEKKQVVELSGMPAPGRSKTLDAFKLKITEDAPVHEEISYVVTLKGKGIPDSTVTGSFFIKEAFSSTGNALLIFTDGFSPAVPVLQQMFQDAGIQFDSWDRSIDGDIRPEVLKRYSDGWVFVCVQDSTPEQSLTDDEIDAIDQFLKVGGRIVLDGQDLAFSLRDHDFLLTRCKAIFVQDDVNVHVVSGVGNFLKGQAFQIFGGDGANNQKWPDEIDPQTGAEVIFKYEEGARDIADEREMNGPDHKAGSFTRGITSSGAAAIRVRDGYRLMLFGFAIESINNAAQRKQIMSEIADFMKPDTESEIKNYARAAGRRVAGDNHRSIERVMVERADLLSSVEERLIKEIKEAAKKDPTLKERLLASFDKLSQKEKKAAAKIERNIRALLEFSGEHDKLK